jgi:acetyltransferase-like isoleucine patch superfamily enzyme
MRFTDWRYPEIEDGKPTKYGWIVRHRDNLKLGYGTDIGAFTYINAGGGVTIEDYVQVGSHCAIYSISTIDDRAGPVTLKRNSRLGTHSAVMPGVTVGSNSIVGAFSLVNRDVPDNVVAFGVPARVVRDLTPAEIRRMTGEMCNELDDTSV